MDHASIYATTRGQITDLVSGLDDATANSVVPATPEWTVREVVAHLVGVLSDILAGNLDGVASDPWTAAQVAARGEKAIGELIEEWNEHAAAVEPIIPNFPADAAATLCFDIYTHEQDLRHALGRAGNRAGAPLDNAVERAVSSLGPRLTQAGLSLRVESDGRQWTFGDNPEVTLRTSPFELMRSIPGRRTADQVRGYDWSGDPEPYIPSYFLFGPRTEPLIE
jgi:uncharacterized protein (TIGR03083 family)